MTPPNQQPVYDDDRENERRRLAQRIEHDILQTLTMLQAQTEAYRSALQDNRQAHTALSVIQSLVSQVVQQTRYLKENLNPTMLETLGLEPALDAYAVQMQRSYGTRVTLKLTRLRERLPLSTELAIFRAIQQVTEHAITAMKVTGIQLALVQDDEHVTLTYRDDGVWMPADKHIVQTISQSIHAIGGDVHLHHDDRYALHLSIHVYISDSPTLTPRELDIIRLVGAGLTNKQIASDLYISARTVSFHLDNIFSKLGVNTRTEAAMIALQNGWIESPTQKP